MPDLIQSLQGRDLSHMKIVAELWGIELNAPDSRTGLQRLAAKLLDRQLVAEGIDLLPDEAQAALDDLARSGGRLPWALFTRRYGAVREMGPGRRDRERPYLKSSSPAETLWYRALVARAFFDTPTGPQEFAYIPDDLLALIPALESEPAPPLGRPATPAERAYIIPASDRVLDHACTLLAALRLGMPPDEVTATWPASLDTELLSEVDLRRSPLALKALLSAAGLLDAEDLPQLEPVRAFLEAPRGEALLSLVQAWLRSQAFNELRLLPGMIFEGDWQNDPLLARQAVLDFLATLPPGKWWSLAAFVAAIRESHPDFQRPAGDYDSWFLRHEHIEEYLRGFAHWDEVEGALIRYLICGPMHWLGLVDLGAPAAGAPAGAFRYSAWAHLLMSGKAPDDLPVEEEKLLVSSNARLRAPRLVPRTARYQAARFSQWEGESEDAYAYRIAPASLERARQQGLRVTHLLALLRHYALTVPPNLTRALERWEEHGSQARLERVMVLRLSSPELLQALRSSRAARFLGDPLGPTTVIVNPGAWKKVQAALAEMGYLVESPEEDDDL